MAKVTVNNLQHGLLVFALTVGVLTVVFMGQARVAWAWTDCSYERKLERTISVEQAQNLVVKVGAGKLRIVGEGGRDDIQLSAKLCASSRDFLDEMNVLSELDSDSVSVTTFFPETSFWQSNEDGAIDVVLLVPARMKVDAEDSSGIALVENVAQLNMLDSSGSLKIRDIAGDVRVTDSSGELDIRGVAGDINLRDSSGGIYAADVKGNLTVEVDSSGAIEARNIDKDVLVKVDSSGAIDVRDIGGNFTVEQDSSGGVRHQRVKGEVRL